jgi:hypothetical protein
VGGERKKKKRKTPTKITKGWSSWLIERCAGVWPPFRRSNRYFLKRYYS